MNPGPPPPTPDYSHPQVEVVVDGLFGPIGLAELPDGGLLIAEEGTGGRDDSAGVSLLTPEGQIGRLISGFPSTRDAGDLAGVPLVALAPDNSRIYVGNFGAGHLWVLPLTPKQQKNGLTLPAAPITPDDLDVAMERLNNVMLVNPFDMTFDPEGVPVVTDASGNGVAKETPDGKTRFFHRFAELPNPDKPWDPIEAVPTGILRVDNPDGSREYLVTLTGGCPYPEGAGQLVAVDEQRNQRTLIEGLNMPIDVARSPDGTLWLLEFARFTKDASCFTGEGYQPKTGRLSRILPDWTLEPVLTELNYPAAVLPARDGSLYISEVLTGRILRVTFGKEEGAAEPEAISLRPTPTPGPAPSFTDLDAALAEVLARQGFQPHPGAERREADTPLARLGQALFFDPILSGDKNVSCATCHHPRFAMADARVLPIGAGGEGLGPERDFAEWVTLGPEASAPRRLQAVRNDAGDRVPNPFAGQFVPRNSPTVINAALFPVQFWDGRVDGSADGPVRTLEEEVNRLGMTDPLAVQALFPLTSMHEMAGATLGGLAPETIRRTLLARLDAIPAYREQFAAVFGVQEPSPITLQRLAEAIAGFERRFIFTDAPWDRYLAGDPAALSAEQKRGALLFFGAAKEGVNCAACHQGDLFTDFQYHNLLVPQLGPGKGHGYTKREDWGRAGFTFDQRDRYAFRTPSLRNVSLTAPYFHDGAAPTLEAAIRHHAHIWNSAATYDPSANGIPPALYSSLRPFEPAKQWPTAAPLLRDGLPLTETDIADLVAFLTALTDPAAADLAGFIPDSVPSGLPVEDVADGRWQVAGGQSTSQPISQSTNPPISQSPISQSPISTPQSPPPSGDIRFENVAGQVGLTFRHGAFVRAITEDPVAAMGGGLCWLDYDRDGWLDLYLVNSYAEEEAGYWAEQGGLPRNGLFRNLGGRFEDVSQAAGADLALRGNGCLAADFNHDGWTDIFVTADGPNKLLWNNGDGTFTEGAAEAGVDAGEWNSAAVAGDLNGDGWPELFVAAYIDLDKKIPKPIGAFPQDYYGLPDRLYLNLGPGPDGRVHFREVTQEAGLHREERGLGALLSDLDQDGDLDLYIANDGHPNRLYANEPVPGDPQGLGFRLVDVTETAQVGDSGSGMGVAGGDYDGDGWTDLMITNWERELNALYRNLSGEQEPLTFLYSTFRIGVAGLGNGVTGWGVHLADFDQDADTDLLILNGRVPVTNFATDPELARYFRNRSRNLDGLQDRPGQFLDWTQMVGLKDVGPLLARGSAAADFDQDGDLDVAVQQIGGPAVLLRNEGEHGNWLQVVPDPPTPGTVLEATLPDGTTLRRELYAGSSYLSTEPPIFHLGLGPWTAVSTLSVTWPDGSRVTLETTPANQHLTLSR